MSLREVATVCVLVSLSGPAVRAQVFQEVLSQPSAGSSSAMAIIATSDGGAVFAGTRNEGPIYSCLLARVDAAGAVLWAKVYELLAWQVTSVRQTRDGGFIAGGETFRFGGPSYDAFLLRVDSDGNPMWSSLYGSVAFEEGASEVVETGDGGFAFAGFARDASGNEDAYVVRTDAIGNVVWTRTYGGSGRDRALGILATAEGGLLIVGMTDSSGAGNHEAFAIKTDAAGTPQWSRTYGGAGVDQARAVVEIAGGFAIAGGLDGFGAGSVDASLTVIDRLGNLAWSRTYGGSLYELGTGLVRTSDGGFTVAVQLLPAGSGLAVHTDAVGRPTWMKSYHGGRDSSSFAAVAVSQQGSHWFAGTRKLSVWPGAYIVKTNEYGDTTCRVTDANFTVTDAALVVGLGPVAGPGVAGQSLGKVAAHDVVFVRETFCTCRDAQQLTYGAGWRGTFGVPALVAFERPVLGRTIALHAGNSLGAMTPGLLLLGRQALDLVTPFDGRLLVQIELGLGVAVSANGAQVRLPIPNDTALCGTSLFAQVLEQDAGATKGVSFTPGLELQFGM